MKSNHFLAAIAAFSLSVAGASFAQTTGMGDMPMKDKGVSDCKDMQGMDMKGVDRQKCMDMMKGMDKKAASKPMAHSKVKSHQADAVVKDVDAAKGKVTLAHEPVKSLNWPAMTMAFAVKDKALFDKLAVGNKVHVEFKKEGADYVVTGVK
ncbi:MAG: copper-binding protein [Betaproteobacteria bacterium]|nr:MAG: copper-binding protein [Betaproteobacteria bacterium]